MKNNKSLLLFSLAFLVSCGTPSGVDCLTIKPGGDGENKQYNVIVYCDKNATDVTIPLEYNGLPVKSVAKNVFLNCEYLETVKFEGDINSWNSLLLYNEYSNPMSYASQFFFKEGNEYVELKNLDLSSSSRIKDYQFYGFDNVESVTLSPNISKIGKKSFYDCKSIKSIILPASLTGIGLNAFTGCDSIVFYSEHESKPDSWADDWNNSRPVYWLGEWELDASGNPIVK